MIKIYDPNEQGIKDAIASTPVDSFWEEKVNWAAEEYAPESVPIDELRLIILAVAFVKRDNPELFSDEERLTIHRWCNTIFGTNNEGTQNA